MLLGWASVYRKKSLLAKNAITPASIVIGANALSLVIMAICPANFNGAAFIHPGLFHLITQSIAYAAGFIWQALKGHSAALSGYALTGFLRKT